MTDRRELLIDAFNVIFAHPRLGPLVRRDQAAAREAFLVFVRQNRPADATRVYVVFDAHRDQGHCSICYGKRSTDWGVNIYQDDFLSDIGKICKKYDVLFILDEIPPPDSVGWAH